MISAAELDAGCLEGTAVDRYWIITFSAWLAFPYVKYLQANGLDKGMVGLEG